jgi:DNA-binding transcriptional LysR family regulator
MQLQHLRTFVRVVDAGGVTRAAEQLALTQPAVTKQLGALERDVGAPLLWRQRRRLRLTPAGELLYAYARRIINLADQAEQAVRTLHQEGHGEVRLGAVSTVGLTVLPRILAHFSGRHPAVRVRVVMGEIHENLERLLRGDLEVAVLTMPVAHPRVASVPLFHDPVRLVAAPQTARKLPKPLSLTDLASLDHISYQTPSRFRAYVDGMLEQHGVLPRVLMEFNSHEAVKSIVALGLGVAWMPESVVADDVAQGRLEVLEVRGMAEMVRITSLAVPTDGHPTPPLTALLETFRDLFGLSWDDFPLWARPTGGPARHQTGAATARA